MQKSSWIIYSIVVTAIALIMIGLLIMQAVSVDALCQVYKDQATEAKAKVDDLEGQLITERGNALYYYELAEKGIDHAEEN